VPPVGALASELLPANNPDADERERERGRENEIRRKRWRVEDEMRAVEKRREIKKKGRNKEEKIGKNKNELSIYLEIVIHNLY
jgi:hypothetical protein